MADAYTKDDEDEGADDKPAADEADETILAELRDRFEYASLAWGPIIDQADIDVRYSSGHTFDQADKDARKGRLTIELDQLSQYSNQLVNSFRQNPRAAKVSPRGGGANDESAKLRAGRIRQIEYDSHGQEVYTVAGENMVTRGYGYARIVAEYEDSDSDNQVLRLRAIPNPNQVLPDPDGESTSGADWRYLFFVHTMAIPDFKRDYPNARIKDFEPELVALYPRWFGKSGRVQIAEYWYVTETPSPTGKGRPKRTVCQYITNGVELLQKPGKPKKTEWKGSTIPFAAAFGKIVYETTEAGDTQKMLQSYIRLARDAAKAYNWTASTKLEVLALPVKSALFAYKGQLDQDQVDLVERSTREPVALILANATTNETGQQVLPLPQYGMRAPDISGYEIAGESFRRDVQNALGRYSVQDHRLGSTKVTSGVALRELDKSGDLGSYHFVAHYDDMVRELAVKLDELLPFYDDTDKEVLTREADGTTKLVRVNAMTGRDPQGNPTYSDKDLRFDPTQRHTVTISTGPSFDSQREQGKEAAMTLLSNPQAFPIIAADAVRLMDLGAVGDQMAEDLEYLQPPVMQQARADRQNGGKPDPRLLAQKLQQLQEQLQHAEQVMQAQHQALEGKQAELASKEKIAGMEAQSQERLQITLQKMKDATAIAVAKINALTKGVIMDGEAQLEQIALDHEAALEGLAQAHEAEQAALDRDEAAKARTHQAAMAAAGASATADQQQAGHEQALEQATHAAALAPEPEPDQAAGV